MNHCHPETTQHLESGAHRQQGIPAQGCALNIPPWIEGNCQGQDTYREDSHSPGNSMRPHTP